MFLACVAWTNRIPAIALMIILFHLGLLLLFAWALWIIRQCFIDYIQMQKSSHGEIVKAGGKEIRNIIREIIGSESPLESSEG